MSGKVLPLTACLSYLFVFSIACGPAGGGPGDDPDDPGGEASPDAGGDGDGDGDDDEGPGPNLSAGTWDVTNVSDTAESMGFHGRQASLSSTRLVAWAEAGVDNIVEMDVQTARVDDTGWKTTPLTSDDEVQHTFPSMDSDGETAYLAWNGREVTTDNDIYMVSSSGDDWSVASNLTDPFETEDLRRDYRASLVVEPGGDILVAYISVPIDEERMALGPADVRLIRVTGDGAVAPVTVIDGETDVCYEVSLAVDDSGDAHVMAACGSPAATHLRHARERNGSWSSEVLDLVPAAGHMTATLAAGADELHLAWRADIPCATGKCGEIYYAKSEDGTFVTAENVSESGDVFDRAPVLAVDSYDRPIVAFASKDDEGEYDVFFTWRKPSGFADPIAILPTPGTNETTTHLELDHATELPIITAEQLISGSDPLNVEIVSFDYTLQGED